MTMMWGLSHHTMHLGKSVLLVLDGEVAHAQPKDAQITNDHPRVYGRRRGSQWLWGAARRSTNIFGRLSCRSCYICSRSVCSIIVHVKLLRQRVPCSERATWLLWKQLDNLRPCQSLVHSASHVHVPTPISLQLLSESVPDCFAD